MMICLVIVVYSSVRCEIPSFACKHLDAACCNKARENALRWEELRKQRAREEAAAQKMVPKAACVDWRSLNLEQPSVRHRIVTVTEQGGGEETEFMCDEVPPRPFLWG